MYSTTASAFVSPRPQASESSQDTDTLMYNPGGQSASVAPKEVMGCNGLWPTAAPPYVDHGGSTGRSTPLHPATQPSSQDWIGLVHQSSNRGALGSSGTNTPQYGMGDLSSEADRASAPREPPVLPRLPLPKHPLLGGAPGPGSASSTASGSCCNGTCTVPGTEGSPPTSACARLITPPASTLGSSTATTVVRTSSGYSGWGAASGIGTQVLTTSGTADCDECEGPGSTAALLSSIEALNHAKAANSQRQHSWQAYSTTTKAQSSDLGLGAATYVQN